VIGLNRAAAGKGKVGELINIATYGLFSEGELEGDHPRIALIGAGNSVKKMLVR